MEQGAISLDQSIHSISDHFSGFRIRIFFADPDPDPDPGGIRGRELGVKGKNDFFLSFFHVSDDSEQLEKEFMKFFSAQLSETYD